MTIRFVPYPESDNAKIKEINNVKFSDFLTGVLGATWGPKEQFSYQIVIGPKLLRDGDGDCKVLTQISTNTLTLHFQISKTTTYIALIMETQPQDILQNAPVVSSSDGADNLQRDAAAADVSNHRDTEEVKSDVSKDEVIRIIQAIASTGRFRHDWDYLKSMLSFQLKQVWGGMLAYILYFMLILRGVVLSEYPEAKATDEQQRASLGESYSDLVNKLDEALTCFIDGPPFTLQRVCEILLDAKNIYPNLSKLALALEKNLLVTSTLTISTDPIPQDPVQEPDDQEKASEKQQHQSDGAQNGAEPEPLVADNDEVMVEADTGDDVAVEMETIEDAKSSEIDSEPNANNAQAS
ncbi:hypothetical protein TSUD_60870 [Trifolium subterraneum]|uniref:Serine/threonine-protein phosphatase 4 regulatory subunit 2 n=1 Tax=Trifolium subterraneum TaxID=3900 RepID=A0A2Z6N6B7_TRISU|nr:hypothetical protein TSUD_60870 [Trifolium subterraneum]